MGVLITGATGYIGSVLCAVAESSGLRVTRAARSVPDSDDGSIVFNLYDFKNFKIPPYINFVVHLAANTSGDFCSKKSIEVAAAEHLLCESRRVGAQFIFISSQMASKDSVSDYGRIKWHIEGRVLEFGGIVIRPGMVYGGHKKGLYSQLYNIVARMKFLPSFIPIIWVQPIHILDLCAGIVNILRHTNASNGPRIYSLGSTSPISFRDFLRQIALSNRLGVRFFFPFPSQVVRIFSAIFSSRLYFGSWLRRLDSLTRVKPIDSGQDLLFLKLNLRSLEDGMSKSGSIRRRNLLREGAMFFCTLGSFDNGVLRRYVRMIELLKGGRSLFLPEVVLNFPCLYKLINLNNLPETVNTSEIQMRYDAATIIYEATIFGGNLVFTKKLPKSLTRVVAKWAYIFGLELIRRTLAFFLSPLFFFIFLNSRE